MRRRLYNTIRQVGTDYGADYDEWTINWTLLYRYVNYWSQALFSDGSRGAKVIYYTDYEEEIGTVVYVREVSYYQYNAFRSIYITPHITWASYGTAILYENTTQEWSYPISSYQEPYSEYVYNYREYSSRSRTFQVMQVYSDVTMPGYITDPVSETRSNQQILGDWTFYSTYKERWAYYDVNWGSPPYNTQSPPWYERVNF